MNARTFVHVQFAFDLPKPSRSLLIFHPYFMCMGIPMAPNNASWWPASIAPGVRHHRAQYGASIAACCPAAENANVFVYVGMCVCLMGVRCVLRERKWKQTPRAITRTDEVHQYANNATKFMVQN